MRLINTHGKAKHSQLPWLCTCHPHPNSGQTDMEGSLQGRIKGLVRDGQETVAIPTHPLWLIGHLSVNILEKMVPIVPRGVVTAEAKPRFLFTKRMFLSEKNEEVVVYIGS